MIGVTELRAGTVFLENGQYYQVLSYEHIKMGRGSANIKVKVKNIKTSATTEKSFINGAKVNDINVTKRDLQYLYKDDENIFFMDPKTYEQLNILLSIVSDHHFLVEGGTFNVSFLEGEPLSVNFPPKMDFTVEETGSGAKGNSATNVFKEAILDNGFRTKVPLFIKVGDKVRIDTRTGAYTEKAN